MKSTYLASRSCIDRMSILVISCTLFAGCMESLPKPSNRNHFASTQTTYRQLKEYGGDPQLITSSTNESDKAGFDHRRVKIIGDDILLPEVDTDAQADFERRTYNFWVVAYSDGDGNGTTIKQQMERGAFRIDVIGADAKISFPWEDATKENNPPPVNGETSSSPTPQSVNEVLNQALLSRAVAKITVRGKTSEQVLRPFTIAAWFPGKYSEDHDQNRWAEKRDVRVFYGDIRTRVQIVSDLEAEAMFGKPFSEHFYVGRVFLRNRSSKKSLAVYTTSMRVPVRFYRKSDLPFELEGSATAALRDRALRTYCCDRYPFDAAAKEATSFLKDFPNPFVRDEDNAATDPEKQKSIVPRFLEIWALRRDRDDKRRESERYLTSDELDKILSYAWTLKIDQDPNDSEVRTKIDAAIDQSGTPKVLTAKTNSGQRVVRKLLQARVTIIQQAKAEMASANQQISTTTEALNDRVKSVLASDETKTATAKILARYSDLAKRIQQSWSMSSAQQENLQTEISRLPEENDIELFSGALRTIIQEKAKIASAEKVQSAMIDYSSAQRADSAVANAITWAESAGTTDDNRQDTPLDEAKFVTINPDEKKLIFSKNPLLQREMLENGYLWKDYYRPMTFQAVLNSVIFAHENSKRSRTIQILEAIATVAGGAVGLGNTVKELGTNGYLSSVNIFSSILVPTLRSLIMEDLKKHITNLGDMAMDTVVIIPPNDSYDRYVFFPRDGIYNFPDEYDPSSPAYIKGVEGDELFVEAIPVDAGTVVHGGAVESSTLIGNALNEGEQTQRERLLQVSQTQSKLRNVSLANLTTQIDALMEAAGDDPKKRSLAAAEARRLTAAFTAYFGHDQSGALAATLAKYGISADTTPPAIVPAVTVELLPGLDSRLIPAPIQSVDTPAAGLTLAAEPKPDWLDSFERGPDAVSPQMSVRITTEVKALKPPLTLPSRLLLPIKIDDGHGNVVTAHQPILLQKWSVRLEVQDDTGGQKLGAPDESTLPFAFGTWEQKSDTSVVVVRIPLHDSDPDKVSLKLASPPPTVQSSKAEYDRTRRELTLTLRLDVSQDKTIKPFSVLLTRSDGKSALPDLEVATFSVKGVAQ